jgi:RecB family exonuclease
MPDVLRLSVSKTKTYLDCKAKFKFAYIEKLPRKDWEFHTFGKFCHKVLEDFHNAYIVNDSKEPYNVEMTKAFKAALVEYKDAMTPEMKKDCYAIIDKYLRIVTKEKDNNLSANVLSCEKNFDFHVTENLVLNGMIDRIQLDADNVLHVCDYKTVKNKKYLKNDFFQLLTYAYVMLAEDPSIEKVRASYILLRHDFEYITTEFSVPEILAVKDKYVQYANQIVTEKEYEANPTALCNFCDYLNLCPAGKSKSFGQATYGEVNW